MSATETNTTPQRAQPGEGLAHWCGTHLYDHACDAHPEACIAFCGFDFRGENNWDHSGTDDCIVCDEMCEARGDFDMPPCHCEACERIGGGG